MCIKQKWNWETFVRNHIRFTYLWWLLFCHKKFILGQWAVLDTFPFQAGAAWHYGFQSQIGGKLMNYHNKERNYTLWGYFGGTLTFPARFFTHVCLYVYSYFPACEPLFTQRLQGTFFSACCSHSISTLSFLELFLEKGLETVFTQI